MARLSKAIVLLSGGLDSATVLAIARAAGYSCTTLAFDYGQRHAVEIAAAERVSRALGAVWHHTAKIDIWSAVTGGTSSALTDSDAEIPKDRRTKHMSDGPIPVTYVPGRNTLFLAHAMAMAESLGASDVFIGANVVDYSGYPDCRPEYFKALEQVAKLGTKAGVEDKAPIRIQAPLLQMTKRQIIARGLELGVDYSTTHSCYDPLDDRGTPCQRCDACRLRAEAFRDQGIDIDPVVQRLVRPA